MGISLVSEESISVHLAGGDYLSGLALTQLFDAAGFVDLSGTSACGTEAVERARVERPDIVLLDAAIANHGMAATTAALGQLSNNPKVVVLSNDGDSGQIESAYRAGACSYLVRGTTLEDIAAALRIVHRGGLVNSVQPDPAELSRTPAVEPEVTARFKALSVRDLAIVAAIADGHTNSQISRQLHLSEATVKARLTQLMQVMGMDNRVQLAVAAVKAGLHLPERAPAS